MGLARRFQKLTTLSTDPHQAEYNLRVEYLESALEISDEGDSAIYVLNPKVVTPAGEWEAWLFANLR
jgi:hypothetical protein